MDKNPAGQGSISSVSWDDQWEDKVDWLMELLDRECPDSVDVFEDLLAERLGYHRHPTMTYTSWRRVRVALIEAAGPRADELSGAVEKELCSSRVNCYRCSSTHTEHRQ